MSDGNLQGNKMFQSYIFPPDGPRHTCRQVVLLQMVNTSNKAFPKRVITCNLCVCAGQIFTNHLGPPPKVSKLLNRAISTVSFSAFSKTWGGLCF